MSLGHVYIVLEPVGSARLTFDDDRYYEFMCFDVPKVVRSPGCDRGHDEESRNGRDVKIDILDDYIRTSERFRVIWVFFWSTGELREFVLGPNGPYGKGEKGLKGSCAPSPWAGPNWTREGGWPLPFFSFSLPLFLFHVGGGILLGLGSPRRTPHFGAPLEGRPASLSLLYILRQGGTLEH